MNGDQWKSNEFIDLVNKDYWIALTFCVVMNEDQWKSNEFIDLVNKD
jgi:hypothetical protein